MLSEEKDPPRRQAGTWDPFAVLKCLHLDKHLLKQQIKTNYTGLKITACMHRPGQILDKRYRD